MRKLTFLLLTSLILGECAIAQDPHFSQFFASPLTLNPAFTGKFDGDWRFCANHRDQWPSIPKAYVTSSASIDFGILKSKIPHGDVFGIGLSGVTDKSAEGALKLNYGSASLSYHKSLDGDGYNTIGAGFQATYTSITLDMTKLVFEDQLRQNGFTGMTNEVLTNGNSQNYVDMNAGLLFSGSTDGKNNYYLGTSIYHINKPSVSFIDKQWNLTSRVTIHGGGTFPMTENISLHASAIYQMQNSAHEFVLGSSLSALLNNNEEHPSNIYFGAWMRMNDAIIPYMGLEFSNLRIGASYDVNTSSLKAATLGRGGTEFSLIYIHQPAEHVGIPCPRF